MVLMYLGEAADDRSYYIDQLAKLGMEDVLVVGDAQMQTPLEVLCTTPQSAIEDPAGTKQPLFFFSKEEPAKVTLLQKALHEDGKDVDCMAMETQHNMPWTLGKLYEDVSAEARWFASRRELEDLIRAADVRRLQSEPKYQEAVFRCYALLESGEEIPQRLLDLAIEMLKAANANI